MHTWEQREEWCGMGVLVSLASILIPVSGSIRVERGKGEERCGKATYGSLPRKQPFCLSGQAHTLFTRHTVNAKTQPTPSGRESFSNSL